MQEMPGNICNFMTGVEAGNGCASVKWEEIQTLDKDPGHIPNYSGDSLCSGSFREVAQMTECCRKYVSSDNASRE